MLYSFYMIYPAILALHIGTALVTGAVILYILFAVVQHFSHQYRFLAVTLALIALVQVISGALLAYVSPTVTALSLSLHMTAYLSVCAGVEALLYVSSRYRIA